jgi:hypothetical protein
MLDALSVLLQGDDVGDDFFLAIIAAHDELEFDAHGRAPLGLRGRGMMQAMLPEFVAYPRLLYALGDKRSEALTGARNARSHRAHRHVQHSGNVLIRTAMLHE